MKKILGAGALLVALMLAGCGYSPERPVAGSLGAKTRYEEKLRDSRWQECRLRILERDHWRCQVCGARNNLNVHHRYYLKGREPWEYPPEALITLCRQCHKNIHHLSN